MKVFIKNIGVIESTKYELGDLTVVCGKNNTGKTLAAYTLYGFFDYWHNKYNFQIGTTMIKKIKNEREFRIVRKQIQPLLSKNLELAYQKYVTEYLPVVLGSPSERLADCQFRLSIRWTLNQSLLLKRKTARWILSDCESYLVKTDDEGKSVQIFQEEHVPQEFLSNRSNLSDSSNSVPIIDSVQSLTKFISPEIIPCAAVVSAERIGAAMFSEEIGYYRDKKNQQKDNIHSQPLNYPLPAQNNLNMIRDFIQKLLPEQTELQTIFNKMLDGNFEIRHNKLHFVPFHTETCTEISTKHTPLTLSETSSSVRSLLPFWLQLYRGTMLRETPVNMLMIDEPEMNLHPENQRILARIFVRLVNQGYKIYITTHSDYIVKELNTLIMLYRHNKNNNRVMKRYGYTEAEILNPAKVRVYMTQKVSPPKTRTKIKTKMESESEQIVTDSAVPKYIFVQAKIDELGICLPVFDDTIIEMNNIQDEILAGD